MHPRDRCSHRQHSDRGTPLPQTEIASPFVTERKTALGVLGLTRFLRRRGLHYGKERLGASPARRRRTRRQSGSADLRTGKPHRGNAAIGLPSRLSALRDHLLRGRGETIPRASRSPTHRGPSACSRAAADRQRRHQRKPEAQQCLQGLAGRGLRSDRHGRQQCPDAARLHRAPARGLAGRHRRRQLAAGRLPPGRLLGGTRMRLPQYLSGALAICRRRDRLRFCPGQVDALPAQSDRGRRRHSVAGEPNRRRMPPPPSSCAPPVCAFAWSMRRSSNRSDTGPPPRCGRVSCAGRGCGRHRSGATTRWKSWRAGSGRSSPPLASWPRWNGRWAASLRSRRCGMAPRPRWQAAGLASVRAFPARLDASGHAVAANLDRRLARPRLRVARQSNAGGRSRAARSRPRRSDRGTSGQRAGATVYNPRHPAP